MGLPDGSRVALARVSIGREHRVPQSRFLDLRFDLSGPGSIAFTLHHRQDAPGRYVSPLFVRVRDGHGREYRSNRIAPGARTGSPPDELWETWEVPAPPAPGTALRLLVWPRLPLPGQAAWAAFALPNTREWRDGLVRQQQAYARSTVALTDDLARALGDFALADGDRERAAIRARILSLVRKGARVPGNQKLGYTDLMWAAFSEEGALAEEVIRRGANVNLPSITGQTPLMWAARNGMA